jgi:hypothetical protein
MLAGRARLIQFIWRGAINNNFPFHLSACIAFLHLLRGPICLSAVHGLASLLDGGQNGVVRERVFGDNGGGLRV